MGSSAGDTGADEPPRGRWPDSDGSGPSGTQQGTQVREGSVGTAPNIPGPRAVQGEGLVPGSWQVGGSIRKGQVRAAGLEEGGVGQGAGGQPQEGGWQVGPGLRLGGPSGAPNPDVCRVCGEDCPEAALQLLTKRTEQAFSADGRLLCDPPVSQQLNSGNSTTNPPLFNPHLEHRFHVGHSSANTHGLS